MKPLLATQTSELLKRIDNAIDGELYAVTMNTPLNFTVELSVQDANRGNDWINIAFEVDGVNDARLVEDDKLAFIDMSGGISVLFESGSCAFGIGRYDTIAAVNSASLYLVGSTIKYEERPFRN